MIKNKQPKKVWVDAGTQFKGSFSTLCEKNEIEFYETFSEIKIGICRMKYRIAQECDIQVFRGQMNILVY